MRRLPSCILLAGWTFLGFGAFRVGWGAVGWGSLALESGEVGEIVANFGRGVSEGEV